MKKLSLNADGSKSEQSEDDSDSEFSDTPRKDGDDDDDDDSSDTDASELAKGVFSSVTKYVHKKSKQLLKLFVNYGPPYNGKPFNPELINECCKPQIDYRKLHKILSKRGDPNMADPTDLYYTPMHWVARNLHFMAMKMLRKAGANVNVYNDMGITPLDFVVMLQHPPDDRKTQLKMTEYLLRNGALVNTR
jgi:ankyrin repeat protein